MKANQVESFLDSIDMDYGTVKIIIEGYVKEGSFKLYDVLCPDCRAQLVLEESSILHLQIDDKEVFVYKCSSCEQWNTLNDIDIPPIVLSRIDAHTQELMLKHMSKQEKGENPFLKSLGNILMASLTNKVNNDSKEDS